MPILFKNITGEIIDELTTDVNLAKSVSGEFGQEDYIGLSGFIAFLQDFTKVIESEDLTPPPTYGLRNNTNFTTIEISY